ncbi:MAG: alkaline phosphatase PhoX [Bacteroidota bacterium]
MKKILLSFVAVVATCSLSWGQFTFDPQVDFETVPVRNWLTETIPVPPSPLNMQILFIGSTDMVQTTDTYDSAAGETVAKEWHDFIGFTPDTLNGSEDLGWISVNHEMIQTNDMIGDGGGMTVFKIRRDPETDSIIVLDQTLEDGRTGKFFNVDFVNTVGETGMNCGGITGPDGRIWTAEEWFRSDPGSIYGGVGSTGFFGTEGVRDTTDYLISSDLPGDFDGASVQRFENFNYMVEIDPRQAKAVRKQYNWGRMPYEGGVILPDNQTVYIGADATPGYYVKFVADTPGDFVSGTTFVYKHDAAEKWIEIDNTSLDSMLVMNSIATRVGATMYNRLEWGAYHDGKVYWTETGRDYPAGNWSGEFEAGAVLAPHHIDRAAEQATVLLENGVIDSAAAAEFSPLSPEYADFFGRVWVHDLATDEITPFLEGGFGDLAISARDVALYTRAIKAVAESGDFSSVDIGDFEDDILESVAFDVFDYNRNMMSNPDGLNFLTVNPGTEQERTYMVICEDLNGHSAGRMPRGISANRQCELYILDMTIENPTVDDLILISVVPRGAEVTGAIASPDGKTLFVNSQHPSSSNPFPYNHSLTYAITGWSEFSEVTSNSVSIDKNASLFNIFPNPVARTINFDEVMDVAIYNMEGKRLKVARNTKSVDIQDLPAATYVIMNDKGYARKFVVQD